MLDSSDYQTISGWTGKTQEKKSFVKKSGWRKLATAFNLADEVTKEERKEYTIPAPHFVYEVTVKVIAPNGRYGYAVGSCSSDERKFAHLEHDVRSTAHTRAKNRAISDLVGGGEVSAEEVDSLQAVKDGKEIMAQVKQDECDIDHTTLTPRITQKEGKNKGRAYIVCDKCKYWRWADVEKKEEANDAKVGE